MRFLTLQFILALGIVSCSSKEEKIQPLLQTITSSVYSSLTVQPDSLYQAFANVNGILEKNLVEENDIVSQGSPIVQIINTSPQLTAENAKLNFLLAQENYMGKAALTNNVEKELKNAILKYQDDSINYFRQKNLWEQQIGSKAQYEAKKLMYETSYNALEIAQTNYRRTKNELRTQVSQANNTYKTTLINSKDFTLVSKINGKVYALYKNPGEIITTLEPVASIGSATTFIIEMLVDEVDIVKIKKEQKVLLILDAYGPEVFIAHISKVYPQKDERNQTFLVEARFEKSPHTLYPGLSGEANIIVETKENVLTIPRKYLLPGSKVKTENGIVPVVVGLQNLDTVEIISGINADTWIYKPEP
ncbi:MULTISPECIES: efflux RND transporter periplasmic adaptor subunit [Aequorivita]|uniref:HlyD family efflux transporter periplasmic adaptor subunit n=1 Tax=Aequorivita iocasae TaxID=2803865 RepID=A0ABX7DQ06_9FLAO|nr:MULTISPECIES: HlyD family efflux transporter periplasmic adaptor subunit [Aequorivita]QQX76169.1 HlyD family efflux transporter periplasmic adaptor subunit [Aequorivita iocasae]UCA55628.1 efflux RND transporter periplasmic adaptor subunit [Aequorivita sp. F7]